MDNDPPGSWNGVVHTPLRKLWVQVQRVATSLRQVRIPRSAIRELLSPLVVTLVPLYPPTLRPRLTTHRRCSPGPSGRVVAQAPGPSRMGRSGSPPGRPPGRGSPGTPREGGPGPPKKGGCRDTKQCKFWRVSSVLIQGTFCFLGVRGGPEGVRRGVPGRPIPGSKTRGVRVGSQRPGARSDLGVARPGWGDLRPTWGPGSDPEDLAG